MGLIFSTCTNNYNIKIAFLADVHLQDIYGELSDTEYNGVLNPKTGKYCNIRTMNAQLHSTRIFNENYFAFLAALDDIAERKIEYVVLPGDFSDDGQPINVRGLKRILDDYNQKYGIQFLATTGNHDPVRPFTIKAGKKDFLGKGGKAQVIMSETGMYEVKNKDENPVVISSDIRKMGYKEIIGQLSDFGFYPKKSDLYWETPFSKYDIDNYKFELALHESSLEKREYQVPPYQVSIPDVSYLVEPIKDIWFLAIDANVYIPKKSVNSDPMNPNNYNGRTHGFDNVITHKTHLINWVKKITKEAEKRNKTLITFSHYPMIDFYDDASSHIKNVLGEGKMQLHRVPEENVAKIFADAGLKIHFGGHMHINDTGIRKTVKGNTLINIQTPSLAAYIPAYKLLTVKNRNQMEVETIVIDSVPGFNKLFPLYEKEYEYLKSIGTKNIWNKNILTANSYLEFTNEHLKEVVRLRFLKKDWPEDIKNFILKASGLDLLKFAHGELLLAKYGLTKKDFEDWTGGDLIFDFYRLRSADSLAFKDIGKNRIRQYQCIIESILNMEYTKNMNAELSLDFKEFAQIFHYFMNGAPADHFHIDLEKGILTSL